MFFSKYSIYLFEGKELSLKVTFDEYYSKLVDQCHMKMSCMCTILETKHTYVDQDTFRLIKPELKIKVLLKLFRDKTCTTLIGDT